MRLSTAQNASNPHVNVNGQQFQRWIKVLFAVKLTKSIFFFSFYSSSFLVYLEIVETETAVAVAEKINKVDRVNQKSGTSDITILKSNFGFVWYEN